MKELIIDYLAAYKHLDQLCKDVLDSDVGITEYIDEMEEEKTWGTRYVSGWNEDYKQLKHLRWMRNKLVHEVDSFDETEISESDIEWLETFEWRILNEQDPFALLKKYRNQVRKRKVEYVEREIDTAREIEKYDNDRIDFFKFVKIIFAAFIIFLIIYTIIGS